MSFSSVILCYHVVLYCRKNVVAKVFMLCILCLFRVSLLMFAFRENDETNAPAGKLICFPSFLFQVAVTTGKVDHCKNLDP